MWRLFNAHAGISLAIFGGVAGLTGIFLSKTDTSSSYNYNSTFNKRTISF